VRCSCMPCSSMLCGSSRALEPSRLAGCFWFAVWLMVLQLLAAAYVSCSMACGSSSSSSSWSLRVVDLWAPLVLLDCNSLIAAAGRLATGWMGGWDHFGATAAGAAMQGGVCGKSVQLLQIAAALAAHGSVLL
jgi:hypothetical protein